MVEGEAKGRRMREGEAKGRRGRRKPPNPPLNLFLDPSLMHRVNKVMHLYDFLCSFDVVR
jgi:hypothetical protein